MRAGRRACCAFVTIIQETAIKHTSLQIIRDEHSSLAAMLKSMTMMVERGPGDNPERFFDVLRAMLFYIDEFPERLHHPKESDLLFPRVVRASPSVMAAVQKLEGDHMNGETTQFNRDHRQVANPQICPSRQQPKAQQSNIQGQKNGNDRRQRRARTKKRIIAALHAFANIAVNGF